LYWSTWPPAAGVSPPLTKALAQAAWVGLVRDLPGAVPGANIDAVSSARTAFDGWGFKDPATTVLEDTAHVPLAETPPAYARILACESEGGFHFLLTPALHGRSARCGRAHVCRAPPPAPAVRAGGSTTSPSRGRGAAESAAAATGSVRLAYGATQFAKCVGGKDRMVPRCATPLTSRGAPPWRQWAGQVGRAV